MSKTEVKPEGYHDIIVRFKSKKDAGYFCGQMSDGFGEGFCDFSHWRQKEGTDGKKQSDFYKVKEGDLNVYYVDWMEEF